MEQAISPWSLYLISLISSIRIIIGACNFILGILIFIGILGILPDIDDPDGIDFESKQGKLFIRMVYIEIFLIIIWVILPTEDLAYKMFVG